MTSKSYTNLLDLVAGNLPPQNPDRNRLSRASTVGNVFELDDGEDSAGSDDGSSKDKERMIIVANELPIKAAPGLNGKGWILEWDDESLILHIRDGVPEEMDTFYVGSLKVDVAVDDQDEVSRVLLEEFNCVATFLPLDVRDRYYDGFCKQQVWPLFHYMLPFSADDGGRFSKALWKDYLAVNRRFEQKVIEVLNPEDDFVWIHDYHLMAMPTLLRRKFNRLRMGFFLHSPFPSSEIYRSLPVREEIIQALLNTDLIGFHTFDYARHFLACCSRLFGLEYKSRRGYLALEYHGRTVGVKVMPVGIQLGQIERVMKRSAEEQQISKLRQQFEGKTVLLGVDDLDIFKGINLKLLAMEEMLKKQPGKRGKAVLIQIANPAENEDSSNVTEMLAEIEESCLRINQEFGQPGYEPVIFIHRVVPITERIAYYAIADCVVVTAVRDGLNLTPYEYVVCRQGILEPGSDSSLAGPKKSMLVLSEFIGCSPSLSGAIRINPWNVEETASAMDKAISMSEPEQQLSHEKHYRYVSTHDVGFWSRSFIQDLQRTCSEHFTRTCWGIGFGLKFKVVSMDPNFRKLSREEIVPAYRKSKSRAILFDYDGTLVPQKSISKAPTSEIITILKDLAGDRRNTVFIVSGRGKESLEDWFSPIKKLGMAAEHGYFLRWPENEMWERHGQELEDFGWLQIVEPIMKQYTESTDGSYIEHKETALVWHYQDADNDFGLAQAKELLDHLESVLVDESVTVKKGQFIVEVKPLCVSKGLVADRVFASLHKMSKPADFVLCIGDDRSDEDMFAILDEASTKAYLAPDASVFPCTVGQKPSKAQYYLNETAEVRKILSNLADNSLATLSSR